MASVRKATVLKLGGVRTYNRIDAMNQFIGKDGVVFGCRKTVLSKLVKINSDNSVVDVYNFSKPIQGGIRTSKKTVIVAISTRVGSQHNFPSEIWRSTDEGITFTKVLDIPAGSPIYWSFAEDISGNLYCATYGYKYSNSGANARYVYKSTDDGLTWTIAFDTGGMYDSHIHCIGIDPYDNSLYVSVGDTATRQIWRSPNGGANWTKISSTRQPISMLFLANGILWGSDDHTGEITLMERGTWKETVVYKHKDVESMFYGMTMDSNGNIYAHAHADMKPGTHYTVIGSPDLSTWRELDYEETWSMTPFLNGKTYCNGYVMTSETVEKVIPVRTI